MHGRTTGSHHPHAAEFRQLGQGRWKWLLALLAGLSVGAPAQASFPVANGKIAFSSTRSPAARAGRPSLPLRVSVALAVSVPRGRRSYAARRALLTAIASGFSSTSTKRRPSSRQTAPSVPDPANGSRHQPPGRDEAATIRRTMPAGFCVG